MLKSFTYRLYGKLFPVWMTLMFTFFIVHYIQINKKIEFILLFVFAYLFCLGIMNIIYNGNKIGEYRMIEIMHSNFLSLFITDFIFGLLLIVLEENYMILELFCIFFVIQVLVMVLWVISCDWLFRHVYEDFHILMISSDLSRAQEIKEKLEKYNKRYSVDRILSPSLDEADLLKCCDEYNAILISDIDPSLNAKLTNYCFEKEKQLFMVPSIAGIVYRGMVPMHIIDTPIYMKLFSISIEQAFCKRVFDIVVSLCMLVVLSPIMLIIAIAIKMEDHGPIFYMQKRLTKDEKVFSILKFRSMIVDAEKISGVTLSSGENDMRITKVGRVIRKFRLDEIPQLINILKGDMSIVGPRPERPEIAKRYCETIPSFKYRLKVRAGLTGYAQVFGKYNTSPLDKLMLDLMYINNFSLHKDIRICLYTLKIMFMKASTEGIKMENKKMHNFKYEVELELNNDYAKNFFDNYTTL